MDVWKTKQNKIPRTQAFSSPSTFESEIFVWPFPFIFFFSILKNTLNISPSWASFHRILMAINDGKKLLSLSTDIKIQSPKLQNIRINVTAKFIFAGYKVFKVIVNQ